MNIELENNSAPSLRDYLEQNKIKGIIFDLDSTLISTSEYFDEGLFIGGLTIAEYLESDLSNEIIAGDILRTSAEIFERSNYRPIPIQELVFQAVQSYVSMQTAIELKSAVEDSLSYFYENSPEPYDETSLVLSYISSWGYPMIVHSHALQDWTDIKMNRIREKIGFSIPYLATDVSGDKDSDSWKKAASLSGFDISEVMVVGDNLQSDIISALDAGCKNVVWINLHRKELPKNLEGRVKVISSLRELLYLYL